MMRLFPRIDKENKGSVSQKEFFQVAASAGYPLTKDEQHLVIQNYGDDSHNIKYKQIGSEIGAFMNKNSINQKEYFNSILHVNDYNPNMTISIMKKNDKTINGSLN